jgi:hypothetical protein
MVDAFVKMPYPWVAMSPNTRQVVGGKI